MILKSAIKNLSFLVILSVALLTCQQEDPIEVSLEINISPKGENEVIIDWDDPGAGTTVKFIVDVNDNFTDPLLTSKVSVSNGTASLSGLAPMTSYFLKTELWEDQEIIWFGTEEFTSGYTIEIVKYESTDNVILSAKLAYISSSLTPESRTVLFMHEFMKSKST